MSSETRSGFHFWNLYQNCRWKFFLRYIMGIEPDKTSKSLIFGAAIHAGKAAFYRGEDHRAAFLKELRDGQDQYEDPADFIADENRGPLLLDSWVEAHGRSDLTINRIVAIEEPMEVALPNGYVVTFRCDAVLAPRMRSEAYIYETKTTGFSAELTEMGVALGDQATMYLWGVNKLHPEWNVVGLIPDIMYQRQSRIICHRGDVVFRTKAETDQFERMMVGLLSEISSKTQAVGAGWDPLLLFDRNSSWCTSFNRACEYQGICRHWNLDGVPEGYRKTEWAEHNAVVSLDPMVVRRYANETAHPDPDPRQLELPLASPVL